MDQKHRSTTLATQDKLVSELKTKNAVADSLKNLQHFVNQNDICIPRSTGKK